MKKLLSILSLLTLLAAFGKGQSAIDSLRTEIANAPEDTSKVWTYRHLFRALYADGQDGQLDEVASQGLALAKKLDFTQGINYMIYYKAMALDIEGRGEEAIPYYEEGLKVNRSLGDSLGVADYLVNLGVAHYLQGNLERALRHYLDAYRIYTELDKKENLGKVLNNVAIIYRKQEHYERAEEIYRQSFQLKKEMGDSLGMAASLQNHGAVLNQLGNPAIAIQKLEESLALCRKLNDPSGVASSYNTLGSIYLNNGRVAEGKSAYSLAWKFFKDNPDVNFSASTLQGMGLADEMDGDFGEAEKYYREGLATAREFGQKEVRLAILQSLAKVMEAQGKPTEAYGFLAEAYSLRDSLTEEKRLSLLEEMQARFDLRQKDNELKISQLELKHRTRQRNYSTLGAAGLALLALSIFFGYRSRLQANKKIAAQNEELQRQRIAQLEQEKKLTALSSMLEGQEQERSRIAHDLHDSLGGLLASVKSHFNSLNGGKGEQPLFEKTNHLIDEAYGEVRRISHNMMPRALALSGLQGALEDLAQNIRQHGVDCELEVIGLEGVDVPQAKAVTIYRIIQELTSNTLKHAGAKNLLLQLIRRNDQLTILIEDDGKGFDVQQALHKKGLGLSSIISRVEFLQGEIDWDSVRGGGTTVSIRVDCP